MDSTYKKSFLGDVNVSCRIMFPGSIVISSYSPGFCPESSTFFIEPCSVPRKAKVCGPVVVAVTEVTETSLKWNKACEVIGATPLIFSPTLQKL